MNRREKKRMQQGDAVVDMRAAPRFSLVMRTAKLLCESGEYVCVVRDISTTGAKIRLFHDLPPDSHLFLELANGSRYAMERRWHYGEYAGFRFAAPIVVDEFVEEDSAFPRRPLRLSLQRPALVTAGGGDSHAILVNISQQGACVEISGEIAVRQPVRFEVAGLSPRFGHVCWRRRHAHGLVFQQAFRLDELARHAFALQPFETLPADEAERPARYA